MSANSDCSNALMHILDTYYSAVSEEKMNDEYLKRLGPIRM